MVKDCVSLDAWWWKCLQGIRAVLDLLGQPADVSKAVWNSLANLDGLHCQELKSLSTEYWKMLTQNLSCFRLDEGRETIHWCMCILIGCGLPVWQTHHLTNRT